VVQDDRRPGLNRDEQLVKLLEGHDEVRCGHQSSCETKKVDEVSASLAISTTCRRTDCAAAGRHRATIIMIPGKAAGLSWQAVENGSAKTGRSSDKSTN